MTEVIGIKFEETGAVEYVVPDKNVLELINQINT